SVCKGFETYSHECASRGTFLDKTTGHALRKLVQLVVSEAAIQVLRSDVVWKLASLALKKLVQTPSRLSTDINACPVFDQEADNVLLIFADSLPQLRCESTFGGSVAQLTFFQMQPYSVPLELFEQLSSGHRTPSSKAASSCASCILPPIARSCDFSV